MRKKIAIAAAAGALTLTGLAVAAPALAGSDETGGTASSSVDRIKDALSGLVARRRRGPGPRRRQARLTAPRGR